MKKPCKHICANCWYFNEGNCYNCDSPSDVREKKPNDVCDGGGCGADVYGFTHEEIGFVFASSYSNVDELHDGLKWMNKEKNSNAHI